MHSGIRVKSVLKSEGARTLLREGRVEDAVGDVQAVEQRELRERVAAWRKRGGRVQVRGTTVRISVDSAPHPRVPRAL